MIRFASCAWLLGVCCVSSFFSALGDFCPEGAVLQVKTENKAKVESCIKKIAPCSKVESKDAISNADAKGVCWVPHGKTRYVNPDRSELILNYKEGKLNGRSYSYSPGKKLLFEESYTNNLKDGEQKSFYETGKKKSVESYSAGLKVGEHLSWYPSGELEKKVFYTEGRPSGTWTFWYMNGKKRSEFAYGSLGWEGLYRDWYSSGKLHLSAQYVNGQLEGTYTLYYPDGKKMAERRYSKGVLEDQFEEWDSHGAKIAVSEYKGGKFSRWVQEPQESSEGSNQELSKMVALSGCLKSQSGGTAQCLKVDLDGNGYPDYVLRSPEHPDQSWVVLTERGKVLKELFVAEPQLEIYSARCLEGQFGEPPTPREGLVVWGRSYQTQVFLYDFDKEEFEKKLYQSDLDM